MAPVLTHHSILALDVEGYGRRSEAAQALIRQAMYASARQAARAAGIPWADCVALDRGDSVILLVPPEVPPPALIDPFVATLDGILRRHNNMCGNQTRVRMRVAVHAGYISADENGWVGSAVNTTSRLLDAQVLRDVLAAADRAEVALIVSAEMHRATVVEGHIGLDAETFRPVEIAAKEVRTTAWIHVPGYPAPPGLPSGAERSGAGPFTTGPSGPPPVGAAGRGDRTIIADQVVGGIAGGDITVINGPGTPA